MPNAGVPALPITRLRYAIADGELIPIWLTERDRPWLRDLLDDAIAHVGKPIADLLSRWRRSDRDPRAGERLAPTIHVLAAELQRAAIATSRSTVRQRLFRLRARGVAPEEALRRAAQRHGITTAELRGNLFADLGPNRIVRWPVPPLEPTHLALTTNTAIAKGMLLRATAVELQVLGASRALLRTAWLHGLHLEVTNHDSGMATGRWQRRTGPDRAHAIAALVSLLPWSHRYRLVAHCEIGNDRGKVVLSTGDPLRPGPEPRRFDSRLESAFFTDFRIACPDWLVIREPAPIATAHGLAFPDFGLSPPGRQSESWFCEIAGLRAPSALPAKLALLSHERTILCLPAREIPPDYRGHPRIVGYQRRVPVARVAEILGARGA